MKNPKTTTKHEKLQLAAARSTTQKTAAKNPTIITSKRALSSVSLTRFILGYFLFQGPMWLLEFFPPLVFGRVTRWIACKLIADKSNLKSHSTKRNLNGTFRSILPGVISVYVQWWRRAFVVHITPDIKNMGVKILFNCNLSTPSLLSHRAKSLGALLFIACSIFFFCPFRIIAVLDARLQFCRQQLHRAGPNNKMGRLSLVCRSCITRQALFIFVAVRSF